MGHKITEAIIENGRITHIDTQLPSGKLKVHIVYDVGEDQYLSANASSVVKESAGIYGGIDPEQESKKLRNEWERGSRG